MMDNIYYKPVKKKRQFSLRRKQKGLQKRPFYLQLISAYQRFEKDHPLLNGLLLFCGLVIFASLAVVLFIKLGVLTTLLAATESIALGQLAIASCAALGSMTFGLCVYAAGLLENYLQQRAHHGDLTHVTRCRGSSVKDTYQKLGITRKHATFSEEVDVVCGSQESDECYSETSKECHPDRIPLAMTRHLPNSC